MAPHSSNLACKIPGWRRLIGCSPWGHQGLDMTEWLHFHYSLSCIGEWNSNPLQCSCIENPRDGGAWWAAVCGVAQSQAWLKWLSSSSSRQHIKKQRHYFANKGPHSQGFGFSSGHVWMWVVKKAECLGIDAFFLNDRVSFIKQTVTKRVS